MIYNLAMLAQNLSKASQEIRILPTGVFRANDGRPAGLPGWRMDQAIASKLIADMANRDDLVIDFEHQTLHTQKNGQPAPAAGWFKRMVWREGQGLFAVDVKWTDKARAMLTAGEYRFFSPVFSFNAVTGAVERLFSAGLTNNPGLTGLTDLATIAANTRQPVTPIRESAKGIEAFNHVFGASGIYHPDTAPERMVELAGVIQKPALPADFDLEQREIMRRAFPDTFAAD